MNFAALSLEEVEAGAIDDALGVDRRCCYCAKPMRKGYPKECKVLSDRYLRLAGDMASRLNCAVDWRVEEDVCLSQKYNHDHYSRRLVAVSPDPTALAARLAIEIGRSRSLDVSLSKAVVFAGANTLANSWGLDEESRNMLKTAAKKLKQHHIEDLERLTELNRKLVVRLQEAIEEARSASPHEACTIRYGLAMKIEPSTEAKRIHSVKQVGYTVWKSWELLARYWSDEVQYIADLACPNSGSKIRETRLENLRIRNQNERIRKKR